MRNAQLIVALILLANVASFAQDKLEIRPHFLKGDSHTVSVTLDQTLEQTLHEQKAQTRLNAQVVYTVTVDDVNDRGVATLTVRYESIRFTSAGFGGQIVFDSQQPNSQAPQIAIAGLVGQSFQATVNPVGIVQDLRGLDRLLVASVNQLTLPEGSARQAVEKALRQQLDPATVKPMLQNLFGVLPDHPVAVGETWTRHADIKSSVLLQLDSTYTLKLRDNGIAMVQLAGPCSTAPNASLDAAMTKVSYQLAGNTTGDFQIQESTGWTWLATVNQSLTGSITVHAPLVAPQTVPVTLTSKLKIEQK